MRKARCFVFEPFRLDVLDERLWDRDKSVRLGHKALAVLHSLVSQPGQLVTKDDLLATAWPETAVSEAVLTTAMRELRQALGDQARTPQFIETVHGRGYRFIAPVTETNGPVLLGESTTRLFSREAASFSLIGRECELSRLHEWNAIVQQGKRRIGFVAGEAGIGKTALVEAFVSEIAAEGTARVGHGQCIEHYGAGEAYLPILEALGRLGRDTASPVACVLRDHAPSWLAHLPSLRLDEKLEAPTPVTPARMFRELADALEILTARDPLILVLEDLHWSDTATLEWLAYASRRRDPARLLVLGTYRPVEAILHSPAMRCLIADLRQQPQYAELVLDYLSGNSVEAYLRQRCGGIPHLEELVEALRRRTGGHPLFLTAIVDELLRHGVQESAHAPGFATTDMIATAKLIPTSVRQFIERRFEQLSAEDQTILQAASLAGDPFSVAAVAAATSVREGRIEAGCTALAREGQFLNADGVMTWPDGTVAASYRFRHALYQEVVCAGISPERRARIHRAIGDRLERAYGKRAPTVAAELAMHFEQAHDPFRAVSYLEQAARNALDRSAYSEARRHIERGKELLQALPKGRVRLRRELDLLLLLGHVLKTTKGWAVKEVECIYDQARGLSKKLGDTSRFLQALWGLIGVTFVSAEFRKTQGLAREVLGLAKKRRDPVFLVLGHMESGGIAFTLGEPGSAPKHFREAETLYNPGQHRSHITRFGADLGLFSRSWATHFLWCEGYPDQARAKAEESLGLARELAHPFTQGITLSYATMLHQFCRDRERVDSFAENTIKLCTEHGFPYYLAWAEVLRGWSRSAGGYPEEGIAEIRRGIETLQSIAGARLPYYRGLLAEACRRIGRIDEASQALTDGFTEIRRTEERWWEAELHRLRGELILLDKVNRRAEAEVSFHRAIDVARGQRAKSLELRAAMSLGRLWREDGRWADAHRLVAGVYKWFTEGFDTPDLGEAKSLLEQLAPDVLRATAALGSSAFPKSSPARPTRKRISRFG
jgi:DNA-binding winged helix-turn-helix (wHTH) protein/predicted ATPase